MFSHISIRSLGLAFGTFENELIKHFFDISVEVSDWFIRFALRTSPFPLLSNKSLHAVEAEDYLALGALLGLEDDIVAYPADEVIYYVLG
jgi:hypothetical protein